MFSHISIIIIIIKVIYTQCNHKICMGHLNLPINHLRKKSLNLFNKSDSESSHRHVEVSTCICVISSDLYKKGIISIKCVTHLQLNRISFDVMKCTSYMSIGDFKMQFWILMDSLQWLYHKIKIRIILRGPLLSHRAHSNFVIFKVLLFFKQLFVLTCKKYAL